MKHPALVTEKAYNLSQSPILIVDKEGLVGDSLINQLGNEQIVVYVSKSLPEVEDKNIENLIHIPFTKKVPVIPENNYSYIFAVDDQDIVRESISAFLKKAQMDDSILVFITSLFKADKKTIDSVKDGCKNSKVIIYGDVLKTSLSNESMSPVNELIYYAQRYGRIELPGDGTKLLYPISKKNLTKNILEAVFGTYKDDRIFYLFPQNGITYLSFAHSLQRINPLLKIDFKKVKKGKTAQVMYGEGNFSIARFNSLEDDIKEIDFTESKIYSKKSLSKKNEKKIRSKQSVRKFSLPLTLFFLLLLVILPALATFSLTALGVAFLQNAKNNFTSGRLNFALNQASLSQKTFTLASRSIKPFEYELSLIGKGDYSSVLEEQIETGKNISTATISFLAASNSFSKVINGRTQNQEDEFTNGVNATKNAIAMLQKEINKKTGLADFDKKVEKTLNFISSTIDLWPTLAGFNGKKTYLVLLQNNMELRPGGGFIGSYGLLSIEKGKVLEFQINDVYNTDGQLKAHVEPPFFLKRYLSVNHLFLRDSSFELDFRNVASQAAVIFNLETGNKVDGIVGVDLSAVKNLLSAIGEVELSDYKEKINSDNMFYITESHVEKGFFPGSTQKKDFLRSLYTAILNKLSQSKNISYLNLLDAVVRSIEEKHLLFGFNNLSIQNLFTVSGWSSAIWDERKMSPENINDFIGINEANLGGNKVNYFVSRSVSQKVIISQEEGVKSDLTILYKNDSDGSWPGGDYKNYLRLILPQATTVEEIKINNKKQKIINAIIDSSVYGKKGFVSNGLEVEQSQEFGKNIYGFPVDIKKGSLVKIVVSYRLPKKIDKNISALTYNLKIFKQPGIDSFPYSLLIKQPVGYKVLDKPEKMTHEANQLLFEKNIVKDENILVSFAKE